MATITLAELDDYHSVDRDVFSRLVIDLRRNPCESLLVISFWFWLEDMRYPSMTSKMMNESNHILDALADEAVLCLNCIKAEIRTTCGGRIPLTARHLEKEMSLKTILNHKYTAIDGIRRFLNNVCAWIFADILLQVLPTPSRPKPHRPLKIPGFPHPVFGSMEVFFQPPRFSLPIGGLWGWQLSHEPPRSDRIIFLTFSRGFSVTKEEVEQVFSNLLCQDAVESIEMEQTSNKDIQPLYARMVVRSIAHVDRILNGQPKTRFKVNGKHIWARKYEH